jgi:hypothetical protein
VKPFYVGKVPKEGTNEETKEGTNERRKEVR